jgi:murein DD-endopeptidase MepM/ murein hydrolase activator NlpD
MAPLGTPLVAAEDGFIATTRSNFLGGNALRITGVSGAQYYYAHLVAIAPGIVEGVPIRGGQVVGWVGNTGDAAGGPTHLHFEIHVGDRELINPFPLLLVADRRRPLVPDSTPRAWGLARPDGADRAPLGPDLTALPPR